MHWTPHFGAQQMSNSIQCGGCCAPTKKILCCCCCCNTVGVPGSDVTEACVASIGRTAGVPAAEAAPAAGMTAAAAAGALCCPPDAALIRSTAACRYAPREPNSSLYSESMSGGALLPLGANSIEKN